MSNSLNEGKGKEKPIARENFAEGTGFKSSGRALKSIENSIENRRPLITMDSPEQNIAKPFQAEKNKLRLF